MHNRKVIFEAAERAAAELEHLAHMDAQKAAAMALAYLGVHTAWVEAIGIREIATASVPPSTPSGSGKEPIRKPGPKPKPKDEPECKYCADGKCAEHRVGY